MSNKDYLPLDSAIRYVIECGCSRFDQIHRHHLVDAEARKGVVGVPTDTWRLVDRRLQALRKRKLISYQGRKWGWVPATLERAVAPVQGGYQPTHVAGPVQPPPRKP